MNFDQIESFQQSAEQGKLIAAQQIVEVASTGSKRNAVKPKLWLHRDLLTRLSFDWMARFVNLW